MASVTQRIKQISQPYGGYLPTKSFARTQLLDNKTLNENENVHGSIIGMAVDYLSRFMLGAAPQTAFAISLMGAEIIGEKRNAMLLLSQINGLDNKSIINACKLSGYDVCYRASPAGYKPVSTINPNADTISNIKIMVERSIFFLKNYGPVTHSGFNFKGGYTQTVSTGDGDFCTKDTLWDFKVSKHHITPAHTLQILMYYIMGLNSVHPFFHQIKNLGFFNPRLNIVYLCPISSISESTINRVSADVIGYYSKKTFTNTSTNPSSSTTNNYSDLSVKEIYELYGINKTEIYNAIKHGSLYAYKKSGKYYISRVDIENYINRKKLNTNISLLVFSVILIILILFLFSTIK